MPTQPEHIQFAQAFFQQGRIARKSGDSVKAIGCFQETIRLQPDFIPAYNNLANLLQDQGEIEAAIALYETAIHMSPGMAVLHCNYASLMQRQDKPALAIAGYIKALQIKPDFFLAHHNLAKVFADQKQFNEAVASYQDALRLQPGNAEVHIELGHVYRQLGWSTKALECFKTAIRCTPSAQAYNCLGALLKDFGDNKLALTSYRRALRLEPNYEPAHYNIGLALDETGDLETAIAHYQRALELKPGSIKTIHSLERIRLKLADWSNYDRRMSNLIAHTEQHVKDKPTENLAAFGLLTFPIPIKLQMAVARQLAKSYEQAALPLRSELSTNTNDRNTERLNIGYVSPDFRGHAVGTLIHQMFQHHDRSRFQIFAYSLIPADDEWSQAIRQGCDHFSDMSSQAPAAIAQHIRNDGIHILIDLAGYTAYSMTTVFALRPAPVQMQYLGYPGTMGADFIPFIIADLTLIPPELSHLYTEKVVYLPNAWVASPMDIADTALTRADFGLPEHAFVFCCFNGTYKINPTVFKVWMQILLQVPDSVLWLGNAGRGVIVGRLRQAASDYGVEPSRLVFADNIPHAEYLARYKLADLFLDTFIYNAGATAVGAFWAGLPVLTCTGETYVARMGASLCNALGMNELVCNSVEDYLQKAIELGNHPGKVYALKQKLAQAVIEKPLFQPKLFIQSLEIALIKVWQDYQCRSLT